jgi:hypothetical protein
MLKWGAILGIIGFLGGFVGPVIFTPEANQGSDAWYLYHRPARLHPRAGRWLCPAHIARTPLGFRAVGIGTTPVVYLYLDRLSARKPSLRLAGALVTCP